MTHLKQGLLHSNDHCCSTYASSCDISLCDQSYSTAATWGLGVGGWGRKAQVNPLGETGKELRLCHGGMRGWSVGWGSCMIKTTNKGTDTLMFMAIPSNGRYPK